MPKTAVNTSMIIVAVDAELKIDRKQAFAEKIVELDPVHFERIVLEACPRFILEVKRQCQNKRRHGGQKPDNFCQFFICFWYKGKNQDA